MPDHLTADEALHRLAQQRQDMGRDALSELRLQSMESHAREHGHCTERLKDGECGERVLMVSRRWGTYFYRLVTSVGVYWLDRAEALCYLADSVGVKA